MFQFILIFITGITFGLSLNGMENNNAENPPVAVIAKQGSPLKDQQNAFNRRMAGEWRKQANSVGKIAFNISNDPSLSAVEKSYFAAGLQADIKEKNLRVERFEAALEARRKETDSKRD